MRGPRIAGMTQSIGAAALAIVFAYREAWQPVDIVWGMWISSLLVGALWIIALFLVSAVIGQREGRSDASWSGALVIMSVFLFLFLAAHAMQYGLLAKFLPYSPEQKLGPVQTTVTVACSFWAIILSSLIARIRQFPARAFAAEAEMKKAGQDDPDYVAEAFQPIANLQVVLVSLLIIIFAQSLVETFWRHSVVVDRIAVYVSLAVAYLPIQLIRIRTAKE